MKEDLFNDLMMALIRSQAIVAINTIGIGKNYYAAIAIGVGRKEGRVIGAFFDYVRSFEIHPDKDTLFYLPAHVISGLEIEDNSKNYPFGWIKQVETELEEVFTLKSIFPEMFKKSKPLQDDQKKWPVKIDGKLFNKSGKRVLKP